jgi:hypothetical protein
MSSKFSLRTFSPEQIFPPEKGPRSYFNEVLIEVNWVLSVVPRPFTAATIAIEIPAAIRPYSIAVAPD